MNGIIIACGGALIAAVVSLIQLFAQRKWQKEDRTADRISELSGKIDAVSDELKAHVDANELSEARQARVRILRFADECRRGEKHSKEHFDSLMENGDIDLYENYCKAHPKFPNNKTTASVKVIKELYETCLKEDKFI